ncbi:MAG: diaminopimelate epimerase [bacterium]
MRFDFTKMQSLGNDFVVLDGVSQELIVSPEVARKLADRHFGVGCDQILLAEPDETADFRFRIFNQDGSEVEQCGNGARCMAWFLRQKGLSDKAEISVQTLNSQMLLRIREDGDVTVEMGVPEFEPSQIPFDAAERAKRYGLTLNRHTVDIAAVAIGNPHAVIEVENVDTAEVATLGPEVENHQRFPARVNAGFMQVMSPRHIRLRVHERGVGETLGCGSGACAAVVIGIESGKLEHIVKVTLPGGDAMVEWAGPGRPVYLSGPAQTVFSGQISLYNGEHHSFPDN